jgi:tRNA(Arg) A34 adenosine deaminase TadA
MIFTSYMGIALQEARAAADRGEVPVGAVVVSPSGEVISKASNRTRENNDPSAHAEMLTIRAACAILGQERLVGYDLYVTLEPCAMCAGVIAAARIRRLYYGASDQKTGGVEWGARIFSHPQSHHSPEIYPGVGGDQAAALLKTFFTSLRDAPRD